MWCVTIWAVLLKRPYLPRLFLPFWLPTPVWLFLYISLLSYIGFRTIFFHRSILVSLLSIRLWLLRCPTFLYLPLQNVRANLTRTWSVNVIAYLTFDKMSFEIFHKLKFTTIAILSKVWIILNILTLIEELIRRTTSHFY